MKTSTIIAMAMIAVTALSCSLIPPRRQYIKEAKRQVTPAELLHAQWTLELLDGIKPDCKIDMNFYEQGRFTFSWNELNFDGDNLWYIVRGSSIIFHTRPIDKIVWTTERYALEPDDFARDLNNVSGYKVDADKLILTSPSKTIVFRKSY